ncbi:MAG: DUF1761 domain-containing protein [Chitinophagales bacterium]|nr:DUF1761 domain-containing protein [Chitinophagales bacterium]
MMYNINWWVVAASAIIPFIIGFIWYHPKVMGTIWMKESDVNPEDTNFIRWPVALAIMAVMYFFLSFGLLYAVVHQLHIFSTVMGNPALNDPGSELNYLLKTLIEKYGTNYRTFRHGALHGAIAALTFAAPVVTINSLFENKSIRYILIHIGYWVISFTLTGAIICGLA